MRIPQPGLFFQQFNNMEGLSVWDGFRSNSKSFSSSKSVTLGLASWKGILSQIKQNAIDSSMPALHSLLMTVATGDSKMGKFYIMKCRLEHVRTYQALKASGLTGRGVPGSSERKVLA